jgi:hypothetical protein
VEEEEEEQSSLGSLTHFGSYLYSVRIKPITCPSLSPDRCWQSIPWRGAPVWSRQSRHDTALIPRSNATIVVAE